MKKTVIIMLSMLLFVHTKADEGMWMLPTINNSIQQMKELGLQMNQKDIYNPQSSSLKDAIVIFGGGCTGVAVSPNGLIFTNHHCGYNVIQQHSTVKHNYLKDGFTAQELKDEIPSPGLSVTFLVSVQDVTDRINPHLQGLDEKERYQVIDSLSTQIEKEAKGNTHYIARVDGLYANNEFYLFVYEKFTDVRFVFAPPSSIGKYGGDTDNWMYPRHTGDFSVFRVYGTPDGKPAGYSPKNVPYRPKHFVPISNQGYKSGDFAMILGNPGHTERYATSYAITDRVNNGNSARIEMRGVKQDVWRKYMRQDEAINIAYANKYAGSSNYWKNSIGMNNAIKKLNVIEDKEREQQRFMKWVNSNSKRKKTYGTVLNTLQEGYATIAQNNHSRYYLIESLLRGVELPSIAYKALKAIEKEEEISKQQLDKLYKDYYPVVDKATLVALLTAYKTSVKADALPTIYHAIDSAYGGDYEAYADRLFGESVFVSAERLEKALNDKEKGLNQDPAILFYESVLEQLESFYTDEFKTAYDNIREARRIYEKGLQEWKKSESIAMYPDANFTMRLTYGSVGGYQPADGVTYHYYTTTQGILDKEDPNNPEFVVPQRIKSSILAKDFGEYADKKTGEMFVNFITNNDITGGNSGSPVFNGKGELIGLAFDGNWEAMSGDIIFDPALQRCINVDIRYVLYCIDRIGNGKRIIDELTIID